MYYTCVQTYFPARNQQMSVEECLSYRLEKRYLAAKLFDALRPHGQVADQVRLLERHLLQCGGLSLNQGALRGAFCLQVGKQRVYRN